MELRRQTSYRFVPAAIAPLDLLLLNSLALSDRALSPKSEIFDHQGLA